MTPNTKPANFRLTYETRDQLDHLAQTLGISRTKVIARAVAAFSASIDPEQIQALLDQRARVELELDMARGVPIRSQVRIPFLTRDRPQPVSRGMLLDGQLLTRDAASSALMQSQITSFWDSLSSGLGASSPRLVDQVWAANRCVQLNAQQIRKMPLRFYGTYEPAWVSSPDWNWFPNGVGDAVFAAVWSYYVWGDAFLLITDRYANGFASAWTVLPAETMSVRNVNGSREYRSGQNILNRHDVVQISRDPRGGLRGTSAFAAFGSHMLASVASADLGRTIMDSGIPNAVLKSTKHKLTQEQAEALQAQWVERTTVRRGAPAILPPDLDFQQLSFSPTELLLLDAQQFDARVIAAALNVPPFLLNLPLEGGLTYQSPEMLMETWWRVELRPTAGAIEAALSAMLPRGSYVEFDARDILAPGFKELIEGLKQAVEAGFLSQAEARAIAFRIPPQSEQESIADLIQPPAAATSGTTGGTNVTPLRPTQEGTV